MNERDASVVKVKRSHLGNGDSEDQSQEHSNHASMTEDADVLAGLGREDLIESRLGSLSKGFDGLRVLDSIDFKEVKPIKGTLIVFLADFVPLQARPVAEVDFSKSVQMNGILLSPVRVRLGGLNDSLHRTGKAGIKGMMPQVLRQGFGLAGAVGGEVHINSPSECAMIGCIYFRMPHQVE